MSYINLDENKGCAASILQDFDTYLIDCDGTLWEGGEMLERSLEVIQELQRLKKKIIYVTNNSTKSRFTYAKKMQQLNFDITADKIFCSSSLAGILIRNRYSHIKKAYVVGEAGLAEELEANGIQVVRDLGEIKEGSPLTEADFMNIPLDPDVDAVVMGWDRAFTFRRLCTAILYLSNKHRPKTTRPCMWIATNTDNSDRVGQYLIPGNGAHVAALQTALEGRAEYILAGKPNPWSIDMLVAEQGLDRSRIIMIGDRLDTDILYGINGGIKTWLVYSGVTSEKSFEENLRGEEPVCPTFVSRDISAVLHPRAVSKL